MTQEKENLVAIVKERYGRIAQTGSSASSCCEPTCCGSSEDFGYPGNALAAMPEGADLGLGCGAPIEKLDLRSGETVLDLGSGAGIDVFLAARLVGPEGRAIGVDMTPEMLARARSNAVKGGFTNVEFREGRLEALPVVADTVDAVTSNCVINLVPDKEAVFREIHRVLKPGGRLVISDIVLDGKLPEAVEKSILAYVGCVSGALLRDRYFELARRAGLADFEILKDVDFLAAVGQEDLLNTFGNSEAIRGKVRSITFRARKPTVTQ
ncbi:MAG TPA: arsenite methyltransferase [Vicinamibacteria bacterium]